MPDPKGVPLLRAWELCRAWDAEYDAAVERSTGARRAQEERERS